MNPRKHRDPARVRGLVAITIAACLAAPSPSAFAASQADYQAAYAAAEQTEQQAAALHDRWTPTEAALKQAKLAADSGNYDGATTLAKQAYELAKTSVAQAQAQQTAWHDAVVH